MAPCLRGLNVSDERTTKYEFFGNTSKTSEKPFT
jgi:hypothetical protein